MFKFRVAVFAALIAVLSTVPANAKDRDKDRHDGAKDVEVVNTPKVNVANTPSVNVVNTPSVNVGTLPAVQLAPGATVGIAGTPSVQLAPGATVGIAGTAAIQIANSPSSPVPVRDAAMLNRTPFQTQVTVEVKDTESKGSGFVRVPAGKRLVIEYASVEAVALTGERLVFELVTQSNNGTQPPVSVRHFLPTTVSGPGPLGGDEDEYIGGLVVKLFSDPGTSLEMRAERGAANSGNAIAIFSISGYFEDAQ
jgi:hypothetical protein